MGERQVFTIGEDDWAELKRLSRVAAKTPVMLVAGRNIQRQAEDAVMREWSLLGRVYGFLAHSATPHDEAQRQILALPVPTEP